MRLDDFDYDLPEELIAQQPPARRDGGRLLRLDRRTGARVHHRVSELPELLAEGTLLVVNDSRVIPARLQLRRETGGRVELLLVERIDDLCWRAMVRASKRPHAGEILALPGETGARVTLVSEVERGRATVELSSATLAEQHGDVPLPPYIRRPADERDAERYQTVYARHDGSIAAPTAGLHLSRDLLDRLRARGVEIAPVTLHVGPGTFTPVRGDPRTHRMEAERFTIPDQTAGALAAAREGGRPVVAVGTTAVRALESSGGVAGRGRTELFIRPGHRFCAIDGLLTNFHLPRSTLLMLVCALAGRDRVLDAYREAVAARYRFYSYGDAMLVV